MIGHTRTQVVFVHGLWLHPASWAPWVDLFRAQGYEPTAPGWPGVAATVAATRADPGSLANRGTDEAVAHYRRLVADTGPRTVLIGHCFGALIAARLRAESAVAATIAIDAADELAGALPPAVAALSVLRNPANRHTAASLTADEFRRIMGGALSADESDELYQRWTIPAPALPLFETATAPAQADGPLLLVLGAADRTGSVGTSDGRTVWSPRAWAELALVPRPGHALTIDRGWREVAQVCLDWLQRGPDSVT
jgi:alpha-beta hydrolase superfamily lysophospholipase